MVANHKLLVGVTQSHLESAQAYEPVTNAVLEQGALSQIGLYLGSGGEFIEIPLSQQQPENEAPVVITMLSVKLSKKTAGGARYFLLGSI